MLIMYQGKLSQGMRTSNEEESKQSRRIQPQRGNKRPRAESESKSIQSNRCKLQIIEIDTEHILSIF